MRRLSFIARYSLMLGLGLIAIGNIEPASAQNDTQLARQRLLCARLSGDLATPVGIAAFKRCMNSSDPLATARDNAWPPRGKVPPLVR